MLLWYLNNNKGIKIYEMTPEQARQSAGKLSEKMEIFYEYPAIKMSKVSDLNINGRNGVIPIRIYQASSDHQLPVIVYFHGGGFVFNDIESHDKICRRIARDNNAVVVSVEYRLAPEHKFPKGLHDAYDATVWVSENAESFNGDSKKLIVMGDSAGGNLATVVCQMARDLKGPDIFYQVLIYPCTDATLNSPSINKFATGFLLEKKMITWFTQHYISKPEDIYNPLMSPIFAEDFSNLPSAFILTGACDPLKDEAIKYAKLLQDAGNQVIHKDYDGLIHGFLGLPRLSKKILVAYQDIQEILKHALKK